MCSIVCNTHERADGNRPLPGVNMMKKILVTGASGGIGSQTAVAFAKCGCDVALHYSKNSEKAESLAEKLTNEYGINAFAVQADVSDYESVCKMFDAIDSRFGNLDVLVNNAGITKDGLLMKMSEDDFDAVVDTNLKGAFHCIRFVSRAMIRQRSGRIINISSVSGVLGNAGQANYAASKAGVIGLTKSAARELAGRKITVNAVAPGFIRTEMTAVLSEKVKEKAVLQIPMERFGEAEDVAQAVAFLASEQAGYITGQVLCVDGGMAM